jgi:hypothetical protein
VAEAREQGQGLDEDRDRVTAGSDPAIRGDHVEPIEVALLGDPPEEIPRAEDGARPDPAADIEGPDEPAERRADAAVRVVEEDVPASGHRRDPPYGLEGIKDSGPFDD